MKKNKLVMIMSIMLVAIALVGAVAVVIVLKMTGEEKETEPTIDEVIEQSVDIEEMTTNLAGGAYIKISFKIETDSVEAKEELEKRDFQVKNIMIQELSEKTAENLQSKEGQLQLEDDLKTKINDLMQEGKVKQVYITSSLVQ